jgi:hypothetical protein
VGRFEIAALLVETRAPEVTRIMGACAIFEAACDVTRQRYTYCGSSRLFRPLREGERVPWYRWHFDIEGGLWVREIGNEAPANFAGGWRLWQR